MLRADCRQGPEAPTTDIKLQLPHRHRCGGNVRERCFGVGRCQSSFSKAMRTFEHGNLARSSFAGPADRRAVATKGGCNLSLPDLLPMHSRNDVIESDACKPVNASYCRSTHERWESWTLCPIKATLVFLTFATSQDREILRQPRCPVLAQN